MAGKRDAKNTGGDRTGRDAGLLPYVAGAAAVAGLAALPAALAWGFLHPPRRLHRRTPRTAFGADFSRVRLRAADGVTLSGWYVPPPGGTDAARGVVVVCHGYYGNRETMLPYVGFLHRAGYASLLFDFRAHGWSGGSLATFGRHETHDLRAALDWAENHPELGRLPLALLGESMGASVSLLLAADDPRVRCVVADSPYARFDKAVEGRLRLAFGPAAPLVTPPTRKVGEKWLGVPAEAIAPVDAIGRLAPRPVLLIHGQKDELIAPENARLLRAAAPGIVTLWEVADARHVRSVYVAGEEYARRVVGFLDENLSP